MTPVTLGEMMRLGGYGAYFSFALGVILVVLLVVGFILAAGKRTGGLKGWGWAVLIAGFFCALNGGAGTLMGLTNIAAAAAGAGGDAAAADVMAQGVYEVLYNVAFGFAFAFLALFGYAAVRLVASHKD